MNVNSTKISDRATLGSGKETGKRCLVRTLIVSSAVCWSAAGDRVWCCRQGKKVTPVLVSAAFVRGRIDFMHNYRFPDWSKAKRRKMQHTHILEDGSLE